MEENIEGLREQINFLDEELVKILEKRLALVKKIGRYKFEKGLEIIDTKRMEEIKERIKIRAKSTALDFSFLEKLFNLIMAYSIREEENLRD